MSSRLDDLARKRRSWSSRISWFAEEEEREDTGRPASAARSSALQALKAARKHETAVEIFELEVAVAGTEAPEADLFGFDDLESMPLFKRGKKSKPSLSPAENKQSMMKRAIAGWLMIVRRDLKCSRAGVRLSEEPEVEHLAIIETYLADKAAATAIQRLGPMALFAKWCDIAIEGWPPNEKILIKYVQGTMAKFDVRTKVKRFLEAVSFMGGTFQFSRSVIEASQSRYLGGIALQKTMTMPKRRRAKALHLDYVCQIESFFMHFKVHVVVKMVAGSILLLIYFRARVNDGDVIVSFVMFEDRTEMEVFNTKTSDLREVVVLMSPSATLTKLEWMDHLVQWRLEQGAPLGQDWPIFPAWDAVNGQWLKMQAKTGDINEVFWAIQLKLAPMHCPEVRFTSHSCKYTFLDALVIYGMGKYERLALGYHKDATNKSLETYAPSTLLGPLKILNAMVIKYSNGEFDPDAPRRPKKKRTPVAAQLNELNDDSDSSAAVCSDQEQETDEPTQEIQQVFDEEMASSCTEKVVADETIYLNTKNDKRHKGRVGDPTLTACGNWIGANIQRMASGCDLEVVHEKFICGNCFGRAIEKRRAVARRMSEPSEPLALNL